MTPHERSEPSPQLLDDLRAMVRDLSADNCTETDVDGCARQLIETHTAPPSSARPPTADTDLEFLREHLVPDWPGLARPDGGRPRRRRGVQGRRPSNPDSTLGERERSAALEREAAARQGEAVALSRAADRAPADLRRRQLAGEAWQRSESAWRQALRNTS